MAKYYIANPVRLFLSRYRELEHEDSNVVNMFILVVITCLIVQVIIEIELPESPWAHVVLTLSLAVLTTTLFAIWDKLGILTPIEHRLHDVSQQIKSQIFEASALNARQQDYTNEKLIEVISVLDAYSKYQSARLLFGFNEITGVSIVRGQSGESRVGDPTHLIANIIENAPANSEIWYMTTFIRDDEIYRRAIRKSISNNSKIKLLLMMPSINARVVLARYYDFYEEGYKDPQAFVDYIRPKAEIFVGLRNETQRHVRSGGSFEVRFYRKSLNFPMLYIRYVGGNGTQNEVLYSGFYATRSAEDMPYIVWRGGDFQMVKRLSEVFDNKWKACRRYTDIELDSKTSR